MTVIKIVQFDIILKNGQIVYFYGFARIFGLAIFVFGLSSKALAFDDNI